jgi:Flp pilus assembly protein TadG
MMRKGRWTLRNRFRRDEKGVAAIEFALLAFPFFIGIFALVEIGLVFLGELVLDRAVDKIGRDLRTGQMQMTRPNRAEFADKICDEVSMLLDCTKLKVDLATYSGYEAVVPGMPDEPRFNMGGGGQIMALTVTYDWPIVTHVLRTALRDGNGNHTLSGMAAFQTEAF